MSETKIPLSPGAEVQNSGTYAVIVFRRKYPFPGYKWKQKLVKHNLQAAGVRETNHLLSKNKSNH